MPTLKEMRGQLFLSQADLAKKAGISRDTVNQIENGKQKPSFLTIHKLAAALGVEPGEIEFQAVKEETPAQPPKAEVKKPEPEPAAEAESKEAQKITKTLTRKCQDCHERFTAEFEWLGQDGIPSHSIYWYAECPKCGAKNILERPNWAPSSTPGPEQED